MRTSIWVLMLCTIAAGCAGSSDRAGTSKGFDEDDVAEGGIPLLDAVAAAQLSADAGNLFSLVLMLDYRLQYEGEEGETQGEAFEYARNVELACQQAESIAGSLWLHIEATCRSASEVGAKGLARLISEDANYVEAEKYSEAILNALDEFFRDRTLLDPYSDEFFSSISLAGESWLLVSMFERQLKENGEGSTLGPIGARINNMDSLCDDIQQDNPAFWEDVAEECLPFEQEAQDEFRLLLFAGEYEDAFELASSLRTAASCHYFELVGVEFEPCGSE
jgi:hypothetical protein